MGGSTHLDGGRNTDAINSNPMYTIITGNSAGIDFKLFGKATAETKANYKGDDDSQVTHSTKSTKVVSDNSRHPSH